MKHPELPPDKMLMFKVDTENVMTFIQDEDLNKRLQEINNGYPYWDRFKQKIKQFNYKPEILWSYNKLLRDRSISKIKICELPGFEFKYNTTNNILKLLHKFDMHLGGVLEGRAIIPPDERNRYLISSIMEEAIASSQLEGAATTREIAKQMLRTNRKPNTLDEKMIVNNYLTIKKVLEIKDQPFSKELILEIHSIISKDTLKNPQNEGKFRINNNVNVVDDITGEVFYTPPDFENIEGLMNNLCAFANHSEIDFIHPIIKGIILHFLIGYIHPFVDGNGRTARAIFYWYLMAKGYWLVEYMSISKIIIKAPAQYAKSYLHCEYDENDLTYFIDYNLKCMDFALANLQSYIQRKVMEKQNLFYLIKNENVNERQAELLRGLIIDNKKGYTIKEVQIKFGIAYQTARTDLMGLQDLGYVEEKKFGNKLIFFKADNFDKRLESALKKA
ncbi:Fic family protein [Mucilaginibacter sp.]|uniref:Fic family protein n=1 Tax=Mucilaginibacter sp. TaxID=1882438 RepID=UPI00284C4E8D|nr:Fic family protein [Mucilaginibacter sp.]MDR3695267.1 Fic family protein [Mucilaginibacter sp.]